jgi:DNA repair protein RecO (recombination protein O)
MNWRVISVIILGGVTDRRAARSLRNVAAIRTLALVLRAVDVFETSVVATVFTRELGKVAVLAKGARRLKSPVQGGLDLLGVSDMVLFPKASEALDLLAEAAPVERFACLRRDLAALYAGYYVAELLLDLTDYHDPHPRLFDAARVTLRHLGDVELRMRRIMRFELACLRELGLLPAFDHCAQCGQAVEPEADVIWFGEECGGVVCVDCGLRLSHVTKLSARDLATFRALAEPGRAWRDLDSAKPATVVEETIGAVVAHVLGHRPRLRRFLGV